VSNKGRAISADIEYGSSGQDEGRPDRPDERLVQQARLGDEDAFAALFTRHRDFAYRLAYHYVRNQHDALDVAQEAFLQAYRSLGAFEGRASFRTWLTRIVINQSLNWLRRRRRSRETPAAERLETMERPGTSPEAAVDAEELRAALDREMQELPEEQRLTLLLRDREGLSYKEIARALRCSIGTVMSRLHYARATLRGRLRRFLKPPDNGHG